MKEKMKKVDGVLKKISNVMKIIFGYGIMIVLFAGGLTFFGYLAALIIGGETATAICTWIYKTFFPIIIMATTILILFGLLTMYIGGEKALTPGHKKAGEKAEKKEENQEAAEEAVKETAEEKAEEAKEALEEKAGEAVKVKK